MQPVLFVSHGSPMMAVEKSPTHLFLQGLGNTLPAPRAIVVVSAHHMETPIEVTAGPVNETIHDFYNFPKELYALSYNAPGAPDLAAQIAGALAQHGIKANLNPNRGLDHGAWIPLLLMYPHADIPVVQVSLPDHLAPEALVELGGALVALREDNVLVIGSGGVTHNLRAIFRPSNDPADHQKAEDFVAWVFDNVTQAKLDRLDHLKDAPSPEWNHPTLEHFYPLVVAMAAASGAAGTRIHRDMEVGVFALDAYRWD